ncbi:hypothetical protein HPB52_004374 [Rhipicephalus sanguineus]|uniref:Uncharacterized protein n=1 Tax=Rhipicephalus sanguineus TaxID=34632 RepID=A0A9D4T534_RHISA|nr:hypothetical protein HPB52_004374 [Rhipicephalus sanguineus]
MLLEVFLAMAVAAFVLAPVGVSEHAAGSNPAVSEPNATTRLRHRPLPYVPIQTIRKCAQNNSSPLIGERSLCTFDYVVDVSPNRVPLSIPSVLCRCMGVPCTPVRGFRCVQVYRALNATYTLADGTTKTKSYLVPSDCRCASTQMNAWNMMRQMEPLRPQKLCSLPSLSQWKKFAVKL